MHVVVNTKHFLETWEFSYIYLLMEHLGCSDLWLHCPDPPDKHKGDFYTVKLNSTLRVSFNSVLVVCANRCSVSLTSYLILLSRATLLSHFYTTQPMLVIRTGCRYSMSGRHATWNQEPWFGSWCGTFRCENSRNGPSHQALLSEFILRISRKVRKP